MITEIRIQNTEGREFSANSWGQSADFEVCKSQISLGVKVHRFARKKAVFLIKVRIGLPVIFLFYLLKFILDY
jgi:hypothetical protein